MQESYIFLIVMPLSLLSVATQALDVTFGELDKIKQQLGIWTNAYRLDMH